MILQVDRVVDEIARDNYKIGVYDSKSGDIFCSVYGETPEECEKRANDLVYAYNISEISC